MSGGYFNYDQYKIGEIADQIEERIKFNDSQDTDEFGDTKGRGYSSEIISRFTLAVTTLRLAQVMAHRIDWLLSSDDGPESFVERWEEEVASVQKRG